MGRRGLRGAFVASLLLAAAPAFAEATFDDVIVRIDILPDGSALMTELSGVTSDGVIERMYEPPVKFKRVLRMVSDNEGVEEKFEQTGESSIRWQTEAGQHRYVIESALPEATFPAIDVAAAREFWHEARESPRTRFVFDYVVVTTGRSVQVQLYWPDGWQPVGEITSDTLVRFDGNGRSSIRHLFEAKNVPLRREQLIRPASMVLVPAAGLLFWIVYAARDGIRRRMTGRHEVNEEFLRTKIYAESPEVIAAQWKGVTIAPSIETFLRRLEKQRKVALTIDRVAMVNEDGEDDEDLKVRVRLLVPRTQLNEFDRAGIDALIPSGMEISSDEIQTKYKDADFDPTDALQSALKHIAGKHRGPHGDAWYSKILSFFIFWGGVVLLATHYDKRAVIIAAVVSVGLTLLWPAALTRRLRFGFFLPLFAIVVATAATLYANLTGPLLPPLASLGFALIMIAAIKTTMSQSSGRETREGLARQGELAAAREYLRTAPMVRPDADDWLEALGLPRRGGGKAEKEDWGYTLTS